MKALREFQAKQGGNFNNSLYPNLRVKPGSKVIFRFISDGDDNENGVIFEKYHRVSRMVNDQKFTDDVRCNIADGKCELCAKGNTDFGKKLHAWVWVYKVMYTKRLEKIKESSDWERVKEGNNIWYLEQVNAVRLFAQGPGQGQGFWNKVNALYNKYGTLCDRDYELSRVGSGKDDTTYDIMPVEDSKGPAPFKTPNLPSLSAWVRGETENEEKTEEEFKPSRIRPPANVATTVAIKKVETVEEDDDGKLFGPDEE